MKFSMVVQGSETDFQKELATYCYQKSREHLRYIQVWLVFYCLIRLTVTLFLNSPYTYSIVWAVGTVFYPLAFGFALTHSTKIPTTNKCLRILFIAFRRSTILLLALPITYALVQLFNEDSDTPYLYYVTGLEFLLLFLGFQLILSRWNSFFVLICITIIALIINSWVSQRYSVLENAATTLRFLLVLGFTGIFTYFEDRSFRKLFQQKMSLEEKDSVHKEILNLIPEGIVVLDASLEQLYYNKCFNVCFSQGDSSYGRPKDFLLKFVELRRKYENCADNESSPTQDLRTILEEFAQKLSDPPPVQDPSESMLPIIVDDGDSQRKQGDECIVYLGKFKKYEDTNDSRERDLSEESIEIKLKTVHYQGKKCILMVVRQAPEFQLLSQLHQASKYKDEILASVSHELRTPINSNINLVNEALKSELIPEKLKANLLTPAFKSAKLLLNLVNDILDMSQIKEKKLRLVSQVIDLRKVLQECHYLFEHQCQQKKLTLTLSIDSRIPAKIRTDPNRLTQIILNLLSNSYKFTLQGSISIEAVLEPGGLVKISVKDTGIGVKEEDLPKLMRKFEKIDLGEKAANNSTGAGLGLSISNSLAVMLGPKDASKGGLRFESKWGEGTKCSFILRSRRAFGTAIQSALPSIKPLRASSKVWVKDAVLETESKTPLALKPKEGDVKPLALYNENTIDLDEYNSSEYLEEDKPETTNYIFSCKDMSLQNLSPYKKSASPDKEDGKPLAFSFGSKPIESLKLKESGIKRNEKQLYCDCPHVMVVDDDSFNVLTLTTILASMKISFESTLSGIECLRIVKEAKQCSETCARFRVILLDGNMPVKDGFETCRELVSWNAKLESPWKLNIIGCTAYTTKEKWQEFLDAGAVHHVVKPLDVGELRRIIDKYLK